MHLQHLSVPRLIEDAHGDPWAIDQSVQSGRPAQISDLATAFHDAGRCSKEAQAAFDAARRRFEAAWNRENGDHPINDSAEVERATHHLGVHRAQLPAIGTDLANIAAALAEAQQACARSVSTLEAELQYTDDQIDHVLEFEDPEDHSAADALISRLYSAAIDVTKLALDELRSMRSNYSDKLQRALVTLRGKDGYDPTPIQAIDAAGPPSRAEPETNRQQNQINAFTTLFGRPPTSAADWATACALDPHSYDPKNGGALPNIVTSRIQPVPGQGVVRTNIFIPGRGVYDPQVDWPPWHNNLGDDRGFSPTAGAEQSRVAIYVDYENGIVVTRQNPSVDEKSGQVRAGTPSASVVQRPNGSVMVKYSAADPFSPGGEGLAKATNIDVNGAIAIEPTAEGPRAGGSVTNFPAVEIYSDRPGMDTTALVRSWPLFVDNEFGPLAGLLWHKPIGDDGLLRNFDDQLPVPRIPLPPLPIPLPGLPPILGPFGPLGPLGPINEHAN